uniref:Thaumatin-like protein n=1 Tax=Timema tahoe TaxID=61484 RepID=A0A7R9IS47_9NEOP|nr:unnamed protein product [Timema tahoe]
MVLSSGVVLEKRHRGGLDLATSYPVTRAPTAAKKAPGHRLGSVVHWCYPFLTNKRTLNLQETVTTADNWAGRFWARTGCRFDGNGIGPCDTGDCGNKLQCAGAGGVPPVSLAEFTLNGYGGVDYYDLSLVDGFNVPVQVIPLTKSVDPNNKYGCGSATCTAYLNNNCPNELRETNSAGATVGCKSACLAFNTDQYCCRGNFGTPQTCTPSTWSQNYPAYFKNNCPGAYSYAYDDVSSTYTCQDSGYKIIFG